MMTLKGNHDQEVFIIDTRSVPFGALFYYGYKSE